ncbi:MAG: tetratricopeptide repeat protein, partial [Bryobacteraceae bacterium]|nr:tetratricopeptide repeat protein [Bryobacteraceae bacterium]
AAIAFAALAAGSVTAGFSYVRAIRAEADARQEAAVAREVSDFLVSAFKVTHPGEHRGRPVTARELLDNAAAQIATGFTRQPVIRQRLLISLSQSYSALGLSRDGRALAEKALEGLPPAGRESLQDAAALLELGRTCHVLNEFSRAREAAVRAAGIRRRILGPRHPDVSAALTLQAEILTSTDGFAAGLDLMNEVLSIRLETFGEQHLETGRALAQIGVIYARRRQPGDLKLARSYYLLALPIYEVKLGPDHPDYATHLDYIGNTQRNGGEALPWYERSLSIRKRIMGPGHLKVSDSLFYIGRAYSQMGKFGEAKPYLLESLRMRESALGPDSVQTGNVVHSLGIVEAGLHGYNAALPYFERSLAISRKALGPSHSVTALNHINIGKILVGLHRFGEAVPHLREGIRGGFSFDWTGKEFHRVRNDPRFLALAAEQERIRKEKPAERQWVHPVK